MRRFATIEKSGGDIVRAVASLGGNVKWVVPGLLGEGRPPDAGKPGATYTLANIARTTESMVPSLGRKSLRYKASLFVIAYAVSDGLQLGDARSTAYDLAEDVIDAFTKPMWQPVVPDNATVFPADPQDIEIVSEDSGICGALVSIPIEIEWRT